MPTHDRSVFVSCFALVCITQWTAQVPVGTLAAPGADGAGRPAESAALPRDRKVRRSRLFCSLRQELVVPEVKRGEIRTAVRRGVDDHAGVEAVWWLVERV